MYESEAIPMSGHPVDATAQHGTSLPRVIVLVPAAMRRFAGNVESFDVLAGNVDAALRAAVDVHPGMQPRLFAGDGRLFRFVNLFVNATDIRHSLGMETPLQDGDVITILPAMAGG